MPSPNVVQEAIAAAPPVAVTSAITIFGMELDAWVKILTIIYTVLLIAHILFVRSWKGKDGD